MKKFIEKLSNKSLQRTALHPAAELRRQVRKVPIMSNHLIQCFRKFLETSCHINATTLFPSILIIVPENELNVTQLHGVTMADLGVDYFLRLGLRCDRTRQNLYGYPGLFRELVAPPPWVEVTLEDIEGPLPAEREAELCPLYIQANQTNPNILVEKYREHLECKWTMCGLSKSKAVTRAMTHLSPELFREKLELARCLGIEQFETLFDCVFPYYAAERDDLTVAPGVPDLFVWSELHRLWFFAEVKGPRDTLRKSQVHWIRTCWKKIKGRFVLVLIQGD